MGVELDILWMER